MDLGKRLLDLNEWSCDVWGLAERDSLLGELKGNEMRRKSTGFSLIELLIVVAIILIISSIAIPSLMRSKMAANQSSAVASLRMINTAMAEFSTDYPSVGFASGLSVLGGSPSACAAPTGASSTQACLIDNVLAMGTKSGYVFTAAGGTSVPAVTYTSLAVPQVPGTTGQNAYCSDQSGVLYYDLSGTGCTNASTALGQ
jgi:type IV pilus assembly protein PilA